MISWKGRPSSVKKEIQQVEHVKETSGSHSPTSIIYKKETIYSLRFQSLGSLKTISPHYLLKESSTNSCDTVHITEVKKLPENMYFLLLFKGY